MTPRRGWRDPSAFSVPRVETVKTSLSFQYCRPDPTLSAVIPSLRGIYLLWGTSVLKSNCELSLSQCAFVTRYFHPQKISSGVAHYRITIVVQKHAQS